MSNEMIVTEETAIVKFEENNTAKELLAETLIDPYFRNGTHMSENCKCLECRIKAFLKMEKK